MKNAILTIAFLLLSITGYAQESKLQKKEAKNGLTEVTIYYENGNIMQHGFYNSQSELHGSWESYNFNGSKKCIANYNKGIKIGVWTYWSKDKITKITYDNDKIISIEESNLDENIKNNF